MSRLGDELRSVTGETFHLLTSFNQRLGKYVVNLISGQNPSYPFPIDKVYLMNDILSGWHKLLTKQNFVKLEHYENSGNGILTVRLNVGPCLNPNDHENMKWTKGSKAFVLNPEDCNGLEGIIANGLNLIDAGGSK